MTEGEGPGRDSPDDDAAGDATDGDPPGDHGRWPPSGAESDEPHPVHGFEQFLETVPDPVFALDPRGHFTYVNPALCAYTGYDRTTLLGKRFSALLDDAETVEGEQLVRELLADPQRSSARQEIDLQSSAGTTLDFETHFRPLPPADGEFTGVVAVGRDVRERTERERRLAEFASVVSHDIRNPLTVAEGHLAMAAETATGDAADHVDTARAELERLETLVEDLLDLASEGDHIGDLEPVALAPVARDAWSTVSAPEASLSVDADDATVLADRARLRQLLENLFGNALDHAGADVAVTVGLLGNRRGFFVADDGPGIPERDRDAVFDAGVTFSEDGTGFGLAIVRRIASAHGWQVGVTAGDDGGARFELEDVTFAD